MRNPRPVCPNPECVNHRNPPPGFYRKNGYRRPKHNHQPVPRYQCRACGKNFCATASLAGILGNDAPFPARKSVGIEAESVATTEVEEDAPSGSPGAHAPGP